MPLPKPAKAEIKEPDVEIISSEIEQPQPAKEVEVDATTGQPVQAPKAEPSISAEEFRKLQARYEYQARQFERSQREFQEQLAQIRSVPHPQPVVQTEKPSDNDVFGLKKDELNQLGQTDWTKPVQMMIEKGSETKAREIVKEIFAEREKIEQERIKQQTTINILEREKQWVLERAPSLNDETSDDFKGFYTTYNKMIAEDTTLIQNPRAPRLVYYEWKASLNQESAEKPDLEKERLKRVAGGISPQGRSSSPSKTIKLSQTELDMCKEKGLSPALYAQIKESNLKEGVIA